MSIGQIQLTKGEQDLTTQIVFDPPTDFGPDRTAENSELAARLFKSLLTRNGIPEARRRYFTDPRYHAEDTRSSRYQLFRRNVDSEDELTRHPHFLKYLHYFVYGTGLPEEIQQAFQARCQDHFVKAHELSSFARGLIREMRRRMDPLDHYKIPDQFYRLALDCDCDVTDAQSIRRAVMQVR
jgi:hypothetical protein